MGVTPAGAGAAQAVTQAVRQSSRWALRHLHWRVLWWWPHKEGGAAGELAGKRKRGGELAHQPVRHSLWEQDSLEAYIEVLFGCLDSEVEALRQRKAEYDEARRLSDGSDSCWSYSGSDSGSEAGVEVGTAPLALEGAVVVVIQGGEEEGAAGELAGKRKRGDELTHQPVRHSLWEQRVCQ